MLVMDNTQQIQADKDRIKELGGPAKVAELLEYDKSSGGVQRVQNWMARGIPAKVKVARPDLFLSAPRTTAMSGDLSQTCGTNSIRKQDR